jgi:hypothetical protein
MAGDVRVKRQLASLPLLLTNIDMENRAFYKRLSAPFPEFIN